MTMLSKQRSQSMARPALDRIATEFHVDPAPPIFRSIIHSDPPIDELCVRRIGDGDRQAKLGGRGSQVFVEARDGGNAPVECLGRLSLFDEGIAESLYVLDRDGSNLQASSGQLMPRNFHE